MKIQLTFDLPLEFLGPDLRLESVIHPMPRKRSAADQTGFQRQWQQARRTQRRAPDKRLWALGNIGRSSA